MKNYLSVSPVVTKLLAVVVLCFTVATAAPDVLFAQAVQDTTAPTVSSVNVSAIGKNTVTVNWTTNEPSTSLVWFREASVMRTSSSAMNDSQRREMLNLATSHSVQLNDLKNDTQYIFMVGGDDYSGNRAVSAEYSFKTNNETVNNSAPNVLSFVASDINTDKAQLILIANEPVTVRASYWIANGSDFKQMVQSPTVAMSHSIPLINLSPNTVYNTSLLLTDVDGRTTESNQISFTTKSTTMIDTVEPVISTVTVRYITDNVVSISWNTNEPTTTNVWYRKSRNNVFSSALSVFTTPAPDTTLTTSHSVTIQGLDSKTKYEYRVGGTDAAGNTGRSGELLFITGTINNSNSPDTIKPILYNLSVITSDYRDRNTVRLDWKTNEPTVSRVTYSTSGDFNSDSKYVTSRSYNRDQKIRLNSLARKTFYYYKIESTDRSGNTNWDTGVMYLP